MAETVVIRHRNRIPAPTALLMLAVAFFGFDTVEAILDFLLIGVVLNFIFTTPIAWLTFWTWFKTHDVGMLDKVWRGIIMFGIGLIKGIPIIGSLFAFIPGWTLSTFIIIYLVRREDKEYNAKLDEDARSEAQKLERKLARQNREVTRQAQAVRAQNQAAADQDREDAREEERVERQLTDSYNRYNEDLYGSNDNAAAPIQKAA